MGMLIDLTERLADRARVDEHSRVVAQDTGVAFYFDLACPFSYLAAERVERALSHVEWVPTAPLAGQAAADQSAVAAERTEAERQAFALRLPLVWPEAPLHFPRALRAAAYAAEIGRSGSFALAASRLAFCGGFDLEDPEILAEAASAAGIAPADCLEAAGDAAWDEELQATAEALQAWGVTELPAVSVGPHWRYGKRALAEAAAIVRAASERSRVISRG